MLKNIKTVNNYMQIGLSVRLLHPNDAFHIDYQNYFKSMPKHRKVLSGYNSNL